MNVVLLCWICFAMICSISPLNSGPFISTLVRVEKCKTPQQPYEPVPSGGLTTELYNTSNRQNLLRGNYTTFRSEPGVTLSVHDYFLVDGQWQLTFSLNNLSCRSYLVAMMGTLFRVNFNKKTCAVPKGTYSFNNMDFDTVDHVYTSAREYGTVLRVVAVSRKKWTIVCSEFEFIVTPKNE